MRSLWTLWKPTLALALVAACECGPCGECAIPDQAILTALGTQVRPTEAASGARGVVVEATYSRGSELAPAQVTPGLRFEWMPPQQGATPVPVVPAGAYLTVTTPPTPVSLPAVESQARVLWRVDVAADAPPGLVLVTPTADASLWDVLPAVLVLTGPPVADVTIPAPTTCPIIEHTLRTNADGRASPLANVTLEVQQPDAQWVPATLGVSPHGGLDRAWGETTQVSWDAARDGMAQMDGMATLRLRIAMDLGAVGETQFTVPVLAERRATFAAPVSVAAGVNPTGISAADLNGDGLDDLVVTSHGNDQARVFLGAPSGLTFSHQLQTGRGPEASTVADFNGDGALDAVVCNHDDDTVSLFLEVALPAERPADQVIPAGVNPYALAAADVDGDGRLDLVTANEQGDNLSILLNTGGGFANTGERPVVGRRPLSLAVGDLNADGAVDVVVSNYGDDSVGVLLGNGDGTFGPMATLLRGFFPESLALLDMDSDGVLDLLVNTLAAVNVSRGVGDGTFADGVDIMVGQQPASAAVGDVDGDGALDVVVANARSNNVSVLLQGDAGGLTVAGNWPTGRDPRRVVLGQFGGDERLDVVTVDGADATVTTLLGTGTRRCERAVDGRAWVVPAGATDVGAGDVDGDGHPDVVVLAGGRAHLLAGRGGNQLGAPVLLEGNVAPGRVRWLAGKFPGAGLVMTVRNGDVQALAVTRAGLTALNTLGGTMDVAPSHDPGSFRNNAVVYAVAPAQRVLALDVHRDGLVRPLVVENATLLDAHLSALLEFPQLPDVLLGLDATATNPAVVAAWYPLDRRVDVHMLTPVPAAPQTQQNVDGVFVLDVDGDGVPGLVFLDLAAGVATGEGKRRVVPAGAQAGHVVDLDGDGRAEVLLLAQGRLRVWDGRGWEPQP